VRRSRSSQEAESAANGTVITGRAVETLAGEAGRAR
jgi:hypothetical protein